MEKEPCPLPTPTAPLILQTDGGGEGFLQGHMSPSCNPRGCLMGQKSWATLWQPFAACMVRKAVLCFDDSSVQHKTFSL